MANVRVTFPSRKVALIAADALKAGGFDLRRGEREVRRSAARRGLQAELEVSEFMFLQWACGEEPALAGPIARAAGELREALAADEETLRGNDAARARARARLGEAYYA